MSINGYSTVLRRRPQLVLIINFCIMLNLALTTLPLYSLAVLLGSDLKDTHARHEPLAERLHRVFKNSCGSQVRHGAACTHGDKRAVPPRSKT